MKELEFGRLLRSGTAGFVVGCRVNQLGTPAFGSIVRVPLEDGYQIFGLIHDIHIDDDGLVRQLVTAEGIDDSVVADNRLNRNVPIEMSVLSLGYREQGRISHLLPPRPALSLDLIYQCSSEEMCEFTAAGRFGYFRHILRAVELPVGELLAAHLRQAQAAHNENGNHGWYPAAVQELIVLLRDDYSTLMDVLHATADI
jgi:hypothetical protein